MRVCLLTRRTRLPVCTHKHACPTFVQQIPRPRPLRSRTKIFTAIEKVRWAEAERGANVAADGSGECVDVDVSACNVVSANGLHCEEVTSSLHFTLLCTGIHFSLLAS